MREPESSTRSGLSAVWPASRRALSRIGILDNAVVFVLTVALSELGRGPYNGQPSLTVSAKPVGDQATASDRPERISCSFNDLEMLGLWRAGCLSARQEHN